MKTHWRSCKGARRCPCPAQLQLHPTLSAICSQGSCLHSVCLAGSLVALVHHQAHYLLQGSDACNSGAFRCALSSSCSPLPCVPACCIQHTMTCKLCSTDQGWLSTARQPADELKTKLATQASKKLRSADPVANIAHSAAAACLLPAKPDAGRLPYYPHPWQHHF